MTDLDEKAYYQGLVQRYAGQPWWMFEVGKIAQAIARYGSPKRILDFGCSDGRMAAVLSDLLRPIEPLTRVYGIDVNAHAVEYGRRLYQDVRFLEYVHGDRIKICSRVFTAAAVLNTLEHVDDPEASLAEIRRVLERQGLLVMIGPDRWHYRLRGERPGDGDPTMQRLWSRSEICWLVQAAGFEVMLSQSFGRWAGPLPVHARHLLVARSI
jgi:SAM-dependent methyltransferase